MRVNSWDDMNVEEKKKVYRAYEEDSPEVLTDWDTMVKLTWC